MGIQLNGTSGTDVISAVDGSLTIDGDISVVDKIIHSGDTNTAIRFPAADTITAETGGSERLRIDSNGDLNLGNNPTNQYGYKLNIQDNGPILYAQTASSNGTELKLYLDHSNTIANFGTVSTSHLAFVTANTEKVRITSAGKVGIGIDPTAKLHVNGVTGTDIITARAADTNGASVINILAEGTTGISRINFSDTAGADAWISYYHSDRAFAFATAGTGNERLRITSGGDILLGTHQATLGMNTADGSDNKYFSLCGGSDASQSRGAIITIYGNEASDANSKLGTLSLKSGNTTTGFIDFWTQGAKKAEITKEGQLRIQSTYNGSTTTANTWPCLNITNLQGTYTANNILGGVTFGKAAGHSNGIRAGMLAIYQGSGSNAGNVGAHLSFRTSANGAGDSSEKLYISDTGQLCTGNYRGILDSTLGSVQINGGTSGGRLSFRGTTTTATGGLGEIHGFWNEKKVASILFHAGTRTTSGQRDDGEIRMYTSPSGPSGQERLKIASNGTVRFQRNTISNSIVTANNSAVYLDIGSTEGSSSYYQLIGFGYRANETTCKPAFMGYQGTSWAGSTYGDLVFGTRNNTTASNEAAVRMRIKAGGDVQLSSNLVIANDQGISFINADDTATGETVQSSVLHDYEEGTFTPTWYTESSLISVNYHTQKGFYQKVGRMVYFQVYIRINSRSGGSGNMVVAGLPYTSQDATTHPNVAYGGLKVAYTNSWLGDKVERGLVSSGANKCYVYVGTSGGTNVNAGAGNLGNGTQFRAYGSYIAS